MFPLNYNQVYIKSTGERTTLGKAIDDGGGSSEIPEYSTANAGQVLTVDDSGDLKWAEVTSGSGYVKSATNVNKSITPIAGEVSE